MISIVTITYNDFEGLKRTLNSIPDYDFIESVIINGGSDISTLEYLKSHRGTAITEKDEGIADAFNKGIKNSTGDAIMFLNSGDELIDPIYLKSADDILRKNNKVDFVHSNILLIDSGGTELFMRPSLCNLGRGLPYLHPTMIVRKSVFNIVGEFNKNYKIAMDFDFVARLVKSGYKGFYVNEKAVVRMEGTGRSVEKEFDAIKECFVSLKNNDLLNITNLNGYIVRIILFSLRKVMVVLGLKRLLVDLKKRKHS
jgi:glycosyltransferase involved in cell wall biosynthesis